MSGASEPHSPGGSPSTLVVDFGTSAVRAAVVADGNSWLVPEPASGGHDWPAAAYWDGERLLVGTLAAQRHADDPDGYWSEFKRGLIVDASVLQGRRRFRPVDHVIALLDAVATEAVRGNGAPISRGLVTVPASYPPGDRRRARMLEAAEAAGLERVELLSEPLAAASAADLANGALALVYDLGAGSFDAALVRAGDQPELVAVDSLDEAAGRDIDNLLVDRIHEYGRDWLTPLTSAAAEEPGGPSMVRLGVDLNRFTQQVKHRLSDAERVRERMRPDLPELELTREELERTVAPLLTRTIHCCQQLLRRAGVAVTDLDAVLLTGGGARMPVVAQWVAHAFGRDPLSLEEPELTVVYGATRWLERAGRDTIPAEDLPPGTVPLSFPIPAGRAVLVRWLVKPGERYPAGAVLARIRMSGGGLWDLTAATSGTLTHRLVDPDTEVSAGQWLALAS